MSAPRGWTPVKFRGTTVYWRFATQGTALGAVGMPRHNDGKYVASMYYDFHGRLLPEAEVVARYVTRRAAMSAVEERAWIRTPLGREAVRP